jgi:hypothetical protein
MPARYLPIIAPLLENRAPYPQRRSRYRLQPVLGSRFTDSSWPATVANEHGNRADRANDEGRSTDHSDDYTKGNDNGTLQQILERTRGGRILGSSIENDVQNDVEDKTEYRREEEEYELPCGSPGVDECKDKGSSRKKGKNNTRQIIVNTCSGSGNCQQATDRQEDKRHFSVVWS